MGAEHLTQSVVQHMGCRVVALYAFATSHIYLCRQLTFELFRQLVHYMYREVVLTLGIKHGFVAKRSAVAYLTTHLCIERCLGKHHLIELTVLLAHLAIAEYARQALCLIVADKLCLALAKHYPVAQFALLCIAGTVLLLLHLGIECIHIATHITLLQYELGEVEWESVGIVQSEGILAADAVGAFSLSIVNETFDESHTLAQRSEEGILFFFYYLLYQRLLCLELRICLTHI